MCRSGGIANIGSRVMIDDREEKAMPSDETPPGEYVTARDT